MELTGVCSSLELVRGLPSIPWLLILAVPEQVPLSCWSSARGCSQVLEPHSSLPYSSHWPFKTAAHIKSSRRISSPRVSYNVTESQAWLSSCLCHIFFLKSTQSSDILSLLAYSIVRSKSQVLLALRKDNYATAWLIGDYFRACPPYT